MARDPWDALKSRCCAGFVYCQEAPRTCVGTKFPRTLDFFGCGILRSFGTSGIILLYERRKYSKVWASPVEFTDISRKRLSTFLVRHVVGSSGPHSSALQVTFLTPGDVDVSGGSPCSSETRSWQSKLEEGRLQNLETPFHDYALL